MKQLSLILFGLILSLSTKAQDVFYTPSGTISFYSSTPIEDIEAVNNQATAMLNTASGELAFRVLMKGFEFEKALMQEHFNENYVESDKYPNATFEGYISNMDDMEFGKNGKNEAQVVGTLIIHGVEQQVEENGSIVIEGGKVKLNATFNLKPSDYDIKIPAAVVKNIAKSIEIRVSAELTEYSR